MMHDGQNDAYSVRSDVFLAKVLGVPVSFFGQVKRFDGTKEHFLGHPTNMEDLIE